MPVTDSKNTDHLNGEGNEQEEKKSRSGDLLDHLQRDSSSSKKVKSSKSAKGIKNNAVNPKADLAKNKRDRSKINRIRRMVFNRHKQNKEQNHSPINRLTARNRQRYEQVSSRGKKSHPQLEQISKNDQMKQVVKREMLKTRQKNQQNLPGLRYKGYENTIGKGSQAKKQGDMLTRIAKKMKVKKLLKSSFGGDSKNASRSKDPEKKIMRAIKRRYEAYKEKREKAVMIASRGRKPGAAKPASGALKGKFVPKLKVPGGPAAQYVVDKVGKDRDGNLNGIGMIIAFILLVVVLIKFIAMIFMLTPLIIVVVVLVVILVIFTFISTLFTMRTDEIRVEEAFSHISYVVARKNRDIHDAYNRLVEEKEEGKHDEVFFKVNGVEADPEEFMYAAQGDTFLYYLNAKFEDYETNSTRYIRNRSTRALIESGVNPRRVMPFFVHTSLADDPENTQITTVRDEIRAVQNALFNYEVVVEEDKKIVKTKIVFDEESGEERTEVTEEVKDVATVNVNIKTMPEFLDSDPQMEINALTSGGDPINIQVPIMTEEELDRFYPIQELERFENMTFMFNPFGRDKVSAIARNYGYQGRNPDNNVRSIELEAEPGTPVYATMEETVYYLRSDGGLATFWGNFIVYYSNVDLLPHIREAARNRDRIRLRPGDLIGHTRSGYDGNLVINMTYWRFFGHNPPLYASAHIRNLTFRHDTSLGYFQNGGGLIGELLNPPHAVIRWRQQVREAVRRYDIANYENAVLSMIWVESNGNPDENPDIMNAERATGNNIRSPEESIERGVEQLAYLLRKAEENHLNNRAAIQAYNYGEGYLDWLIEEEIDHTFNVARIYSRGRSNRTTVPFNHPVAYNLGYSWRFDYGNMFYQLMVSQNIRVEAGRLVQIARDEIGTESGQKYWGWLGFNQSVEWSGAFVSWVANEAGYLAQDLIPKTVNVGQMKSWFEERRKFIPVYDREYAPQAGDLVFFDFAGGTSGRDRVGIVEFSDGRIIQTIEGNANGQVRRVSYAMDDVTIAGYGVTR
jgi:murein DD-endopeptidase MepM/ murein hydrolase activator NlpD